MNYVIKAFTVVVTHSHVCSIKVVLSQATDMMAHTHKYKGPAMQDQFVLHFHLPSHRIFIIHCAIINDYIHSQISLLC